MRKPVFPSNYEGRPQVREAAPIVQTNAHRRRHRAAVHSYDKGRRYHRAPAYRGSYKKTLRDHRG